MSRSKFLGVTALIAIIGGSAVAQTTNVQLPEELAALNLSDIRTDSEHDGQVEVEGTTADGLRVEAQLNADGKLLDVDVDNGTMPQSLIDALLPEAARNSDVMAQFATIDSIETNNGSFEVQDEDGSRQEVFAVFDQAGKVLRSGQDD